jgi:hypothetical protein
MKVRTRRRINTRTTRMMKIRTTRMINIRTTRMINIRTTRKMKIRMTRKMKTRTTRMINIRMTRKMKIRTTRMINIRMTRKMKIRTTRMIKIRMTLMAKRHLQLCPHKSQLSVRARAPLVTTWIVLMRKNRIRSQPAPLSVQQLTPQKKPRDQVAAAVAAYVSFATTLVSLLTQASKWTMSHVRIGR